MKAIAGEPRAAIPQASAAQYSIPSSASSSAFLLPRRVPRARILIVFRPTFIIITELHILSPRSSSSHNGAPADSFFILHFMTTLTACDRRDTAAQEPRPWTRCPACRRSSHRLPLLLSVGHTHTAVISLNLRFVISIFNFIFIEASRYSSASWYL